MENNEFLSPEYISKKLSVTPHAVRKWCREGLLPYAKFGRTVRIRAVDFEKFCQDNTV